MRAVSWTSNTLTSGSALLFERHEAALVIRGGRGTATALGRGYWKSSPIRVTEPRAIEVTTEVESDSEDAVMAARAILQWHGEDGSLLGVDYLLPRDHRDCGHSLSLLAEPPRDAQTCTIVLLAADLSSEFVRWSLPQITARPIASPRQAAVASTRLPVNRDGTVDFNLSQIAPALARMKARRPDVLCLPEMCASWGVDGSLREVATPRAAFLAELAKGAAAAQAYVAAAFYELASDGEIYNTALLVDRNGRLIGEYRKTHLTTSEILAGVQPGNALDVFDTDVGRIAIVICWDMWYPEPARLASLKQADILLWPYEQDRHAEHRQVTARARAMDNGVVIVGASQATPAPIVDADGTVLAELGPDRPAFAVVEVGGPLRGSRWPQSPPAHRIRRNLITGERSRAISDEIARISRPN